MWPVAGSALWGQAVAVAEPVRVRRLTDQEGQQLQQIMRRGTGSVRFRRAMVVLASAGGNTVPAIARLVQADEDTVRQVIHRFNEMGLACLDPRWAGGRPRLISPDDEAFIVATATTRPEAWASPSPAGASANSPTTCATPRPPAGSHRPGTAAAAAAPPRDHLPAHQDVEGVHRPGPRRETRPDRGGHGPLPGPGVRVRRVRPAGDPPARRLRLGAARATRDRLPANYHKLHGVRYFHGCY